VPITYCELKLNCIFAIAVPKSRCSTKTGGSIGRHTTANANMEPCKERQLDCKESTVWSEWLYWYVRMEPSLLLCKSVNNSLRCLLIVTTAADAAARLLSVFVNWSSFPELLQVGPGFVKLNLWSRIVTDLDTIPVGHPAMSKPSLVK